MEYNALNSKVKAMRAGLLTKPQYQVLCRSQSKEHFLAQLPRGYAYGRDSLAEELERLRLFLADVNGRRILTTMAEQDYTRTWACIKTLPKSQNRQALTYIKGSEIDLQNILRIYRLKRHYPDAEVYPHLIPVCYRLNRELIKHMAESPGVAEFTVALKNTHYDRFNFEKPEQAIFLHMRRVYSKAAKRYPHSLAETTSYFFEKNNEIYNIIAISEGLSYRLPPDEIMSCLCL